MEGRRKSKRDGQTERGGGGGVFGKGRKEGIQTDRDSIGRNTGT